MVIKKLDPFNPKTGGAYGKGYIAKFDNRIPKTVTPKTPTNNNRSRTDNQQAEGELIDKNQLTNISSGVTPVYKNPKGDFTTGLTDIKPQVQNTSGFSDIELAKLKNQGKKEGIDSMLKRIKDSGKKDEFLNKLEGTTNNKVIDGGEDLQDGNKIESNFTELQQKELDELKIAKDKKIDATFKAYNLGKGEYEKQKNLYLNYDKINTTFEGVLKDLRTYQEESQSGDITDEQYKVIANKYKLDINDVKTPQNIFKGLEASEEGKKTLGIDKFDDSLADFTTKFDRQKEDMQTNIDNTKIDTEKAIADIERDIKRNIDFAIAQGVWNGSVRSSGFETGMQNIKSDGARIIARLDTSLKRAEDANDTNLDRLTTDYNKAITSAKEGFTTELGNIKYNAGLKLNGLTEQYGLGSDTLTKALETVGTEYFNMTSDAVLKFQQVTRNEQIKTNAALDLYTKAQDITNDKLNLRFDEYTADDGSILQNTSLNTLANDVTSGNLTQTKYDDLKNIMLSGIQTQLGEDVQLTTTDISTIKDMLGKGSTPAEIMATMREDDRFKEVEEEKTTQDWSKLGDNSLYNKRTGETKNVETGETTSDTISAEDAKIGEYKLGDGTTITATKGLVNGLNNVMSGNSEIQFDMNNLYRTQEEQYTIFGKGRTAEQLEAVGVPTSYAQPDENIVSWTTNSSHMTGNAVDVVLPQGEDKVKYFEGIDAEMNKNGFFRPEETIARGDYGHYEYKGVDAKELTAREILEASNLSVDIFGQRVGGKPESIKKVEDLMKEGMNVDEIEDFLRGGSYGQEFTGVYKSAFQNISSDFTKDKRDNNRESLEDKIQEYGTDSTQVRSFIKKISRDSMAADQEKKVLGYEGLKDSLGDIGNDLKQYEDLHGDTNIFKGKIEGLVKKVGNVKDPELRRIATKIAKSIQSYRQAVSGAAFTESEAKEYKAIFPSIDNVAELNSAIMKGMMESNQTSINSAYRQAMGKQAYEDIFRVKNVKEVESETQSEFNSYFGIPNEDEDTDALFNNYFNNVG